MIFNRVNEIDGIIKEYSDWRSEKNPMIAGAERSLLIRFCKSFDIRNLTDITEDRVGYFVGEELSDFYSERARRCFRSFLRYCRWAGYYEAPSTEAKLIDFMKVTKQGRPRDTSMMKEVKELRSRGVSTRKAASLLSEKYGRKIYQNSVFRWLSYAD